MTLIERLSRLIDARTLPRSPELALQDAIAGVLSEHGFTFSREARLTTSDVIDFLVDRAGLEVKVDGSLSDVTRQLHRYAQSDRVSELLLVTTRSKHRAMPASLSGKPVRVLHLLRGCL